MYTRSAAGTLLAALAALSACSAQQGYASAQAWRRNQCLQINDDQERMRCLKEADQPYDDYKKSSDAIKASP